MERNRLDLLAHSGEPPEWVPHGTGRCTCTAEGEDPHCPHHGYEAVIQRLRHELAGAVDLLREARFYVDARATGSVKAAELLARIDAAIGGQ